MSGDPQGDEPSAVVDMPQTLRAARRYLRRMDFIATAITTTMTTTPIANRPGMYETPRVEECMQHRVEG